MGSRAIGAGILRINFSKKRRASDFKTDRENRLLGGQKTKSRNNTAINPYFKNPIKNFRT